MEIKKMRVYTEEKAAGLEHDLSQAEKITIACKFDRLLDKQAFDERLKNGSYPALADVASDNFDLYPVRTIMVTTGWNGNDDVFVKEEAWAARNSPIDKPFNLSHIPSKIIGHIINSCGMTIDGEVISTKTDISDVPDQFHLITDAVIYRQLGKRDPELTKEVADLISGIENGDWYVSMECLFSDFDYAYRDTDEIIVRSEATAYLTKHLKRYGGSGEYGGRKLGRVLRNITFCGKGLVENPANEHSVFLPVESFAGTITEDNITNSKSNRESTVMDELKLQNESLRKELADARQKLEEFNEAAVTAKLEARDATIAKRDETIAGLETKVKDLTAKVDGLEKEKKEATEKLEKTQADLDEMAAKELKTARISILVDKGVDKAEAEKVVDEFAGIDDDKFSKIVEMQEALIKKETETAENTETDTETDDTSEADLETAEAEEGGDLSAEAETGEEKREEAIAELAGFIAHKLGQKEEGE
jgi:hypothetical protein